MTQLSTSFFIWTECEIPIENPSTDFRADIWCQHYEPNQAEFNFEAVHEHIENPDLDFEVDQNSIRSTSSVFGFDSDNWSISSGSVARFLDTTIFDDMAVDEIIPLQGDQEGPEPFSTTTSNIMDWADQTALPTPSASVANASQHMSNSSETSELQKRLPLIYDIATLLKLRQAMDGKRVELRINPAALAENVFKDSTNTHLTHQKDMSSRGPSSFTRRSTDSDEELTFQGRILHQPFRQPRAPPKTPHAQQNEGFARFLKQYASPPHHRVTAGGRIVPVGPLSPPPMLNLDSLDGLLEKQSGVTGPARKINRARLPPGRTQTTNTGSGLGEPWPNRIGITSAESLASTAHTQGVCGTAYGVGNGVSQPIATSSYAMPSMGPTVQFPSGPVSTMMLQDGSTIHSLNGLMYRSYWNGTEMVLEPLNVPLATPVLHEYPMASFGGSQAWFGTHSTINLPTLLGNAASGSQAYLSQHNQDLRAPALHNQFENLQSQLTALDKHVALHLHELPPTVHAGLVAQRKELVEQLDNVRVAKEQFDRSGTTATPVFSPYAMANIGDYQHSFGPQGTRPSLAMPATTVPLSFITPRYAATPVSMEYAIDQTGSTANNSSGAATNKGLSPDAPAFIPSFGQCTSSKTGKTHSEVPNQHGKPSRASALTINTHTPGGNKFIFTSPSDQYEVKDASQGMVQQTQPGETAAARRSAAASSLRSSSHDVLPVVSEQEAEYVDRLGLNPTDSPTLYCRVPAHFQEVIRRAREQATLYGCLGGQSKDPAYDAEQDIRWAMSDFEPIQLPKQTPDHFAKPRPWNWNDSAYNYRVVRHTNSSLGNGSSQMREPMRTEDTETKAKPPSTALKATMHDIMTHQRANSWDTDYGQTGWLDLDTVKSGEGKPSESVGLEGHAASRRPLSTTSGNSYPSQTPKTAFLPNTQYSESDTRNECGSLNKARAQLNTNDQADIVKLSEEQPETPSRRQYHAYVESYTGSPSTPLDKFTTLSPPADVVKASAANNDQWQFENNDPNSWSPVTKSKDDCGPNLHGDTIYTHNTDNLDPRGKEEASARKMAARTTLNAGLPASMGNYVSETRKTSRPATSSETRATANTDMFKAPNNPTSTGPETKKKKLTSKKNKSVDSSSTTSNKSKHEFLRGMLDSALYFSTRTDRPRVKHARYIPASERGPVRFNANGDDWEEDTLKKENVWAEGQYSNNRSGNGAPVATPVSSGNPVYFGQDARVIKAPYSVASSTYHAQGLMPQYDNRGNQLASKANHGFVPQYDNTGTQLASKAYHGFVPRNQGAIDHRIASHATTQTSPLHQYSGTQSVKQSYRNSRKPGHYGEEFLNSFQ